MPAAGCSGVPLQMILEDTATNEALAVTRVRKLVTQDKVDVVLGGITSSMRNAIKDTIVNRGKTLYIYPQLYEGKECTPYLFCTGPDAGTAMRHVHPVADQERRQEVLSSLRRLRVAARAQRVRTQDHREERRRGGGRGVLPGRPQRVQRHREQDHVEQGERGVQHHHPAGRGGVLQAALRGRASARAAAACLRVLRRERAQYHARQRDRRAGELPGLLQGRERSLAATRSRPSTTSSIPETTRSPRAARPPGCIAGSSCGRRR